MIYPDRLHYHRRYVVISVVLIAVVLLLAARHLTADLTFFTVDTGLRFVQVQEIIRQDWTTLAVDYPGRAFDPDLQHTPFYYVYLLVDEQIFLSITPFLPLAAAGLFSLIGSIGLLLLPVLGGLFIAVGLYKLGAIVQLQHRLLLLWAAMFATPVVFYSLTFWDHTIAVALLVWGMFFWVRGLMSPQSRWDWVGGGLCFGLSLGQRPEAYLFVVAAAVALLILSWRQWHNWLLAAAGGLVGLLPIWISQYIWFGHPLGPVMGASLLGYGRLQSYPVQPYAEFADGLPLSLKIGRLLFFVESRDPVTFVALLAVLIGLALVVLQLRLQPTDPKLLPGLALLLVAYLIWLREAWSQPIPGLMTTFPLIPLSLTYIEKVHPTPRHQKVYHFTLITLCLFLVLALWSMPFGGGQWGARYLLPAYPLLLFLAVYVFETYAGRIVEGARFQFQLLFVTLLVTSVILQAAGLKNLWDKHAGEAEMKQLVANLPVEWILTSDPFLPSFMSAVPDKSFLYVADQAGIERLIPRLADGGVTCFAIIESAPNPLTVPTQINDVTLAKVTPAVYALLPATGSDLPVDLTTAYCNPG